MMLLSSQLLPSVAVHVDTMTVTVMLGATKVYSVTITGNNLVAH